MQEQPSGRFVVAEFHAGGRGTTVSAVVGTLLQHDGVTRPLIAATVPE